MNKREKEQVEREIDRQCERVTNTVTSYWILAIIVSLYKVYGFKETSILKMLKVAMLSRSCLIEYINNEKLKGTTVQELLGGK